MWTGRRRESWSDALLSLAPLAPPGLRLWAARRAAARGLGASALRAAPRDPLVLTRLGLHAAARASSGGGEAGELARAAACAALGCTGPAARYLEQRRGTPADRRFLAAAAAPFDPRLAGALLPQAEATGRAACALAAGEIERAASLLALAGTGQQQLYLAAALAAGRAAGPAALAGDWMRARECFNRAFVADGLTPPLDAQADCPTTLEAFGQPPNPSGPASAEEPLVSVVMAAHDAAETLSVAAASILAQTWRALELIIVDDASRDATAGVARRLAARDRRIRVLDNDRRPGAYGARNTGLAAAKGSFVALHDADDWAHPQRLERQMAVLARGAGLTLCRHIRLDLQGRPVCPRVFPFVRLSPITMTARAEAFAAAGPFEEVALGADSEWVARFDARFGRRAAPRANEVGLVALWAPGSLSASPSSGLLGEGTAARAAYVEAWRRRHAEAWRPYFAPRGDTG